MDIKRDLSNQKSQMQLRLAARKKYRDLSANKSGSLDESASMTARRPSTSKASFGKGFQFGAATAKQGSEDIAYAPTTRPMNTGNNHLSFSK